MIISFQDFRDAEYFIPKEILESAGAKIITISSEKGLAIGADGGEATVNLAISEVNLENLDAAVFVGGPGMIKNLDDENFQKLTQDTVQNNKVLGAICIAPAMLAKAGVLQKKKATVWSNVLDKSAVKTLQKAGAIYKDEPVVVDGKIVTANGPDAAQEFAEALINLLK